jgi:hypothetical protein
MRSGQKLHVLTDGNGNIVAAAVLDTGTRQPSDAQVQITPIEGQSLVVAPMNSDLGKLENEEDFRRLTNEFYAPRGKKKLARRDGSEQPRKRR